MQDRKGGRKGIKTEHKFGKQTTQKKHDVKDKQHVKIKERKEKAPSRFDPCFKKYFCGVVSTDLSKCRYFYFFNLCDSIC